MATIENLLIVDDEPDLRDVLAYVLADSVKTVQMASNGKEALPIIKTGKIDVVLSDINMPEMNGLELLAEVRRQGLDTPFVFLTAYGDAEKRAEAQRLGASDFLEKPFKKPHVIAAMQKAFDQSKANQ